MRRDGLVALREAKRLSQKQLADRLAVHHTTVQRWEKGASTPYRWQRSAIARELGLSIEDLDRVLAGETLDRSPDRTAALADLEALELIRRVEATDVGARTLAAIAEVVDQIALRYAGTAPAESCTAILVYQQYLARLLQGRATLAQRIELMRHAGWLSLLAATAHMDLGQDIAAAANLRAVRTLADETGDTVLAAWAMETQAWHALSLGDLRPAAALCREGLRLAPRSTSAYVQLCTQAARVSARLGDGDRTRRLVDESLAAVAGLPTSRPGHHFDCDEKRVVAHCAAAIVWLGEPSQMAEDYARRAVSQFDEGDVHHLATARINLAILLAGRDEPGEAAWLGHLALDASWRLCRTDHFLAADLDDVLTSRYPGDRDVTSFHERFVGSDCFDQREAIDLPDLPQLEPGRD